MGVIVSLKPEERTCLYDIEGDTFNIKKTLPNCINVIKMQYS